MPGGALLDYRKHLQAKPKGKISRNGTTTSKNHSHSMLSSQNSATKKPDFYAAILVVIVVVIGSFSTYDLLPKWVEQTSECVPKELPWKLTGQPNLVVSLDNKPQKIETNSFVTFPIGTQFTGTIQIENPLAEALYVKSLTLSGPFGFGDAFSPELSRTGISSPSPFTQLEVIQSGDNFILSLPAPTGDDCGMLLAPGGKAEIIFSMMAHSETRLYGDFIILATPRPRTSWLFDPIFKPNIETVRDVSIRVGN